MPDGIYTGKGHFVVARKGELSVVDGQEPMANADKVAIETHRYVAFATNLAVGVVQYYHLNPNLRNVPTQAEIASTSYGGLKTYSPWASAILWPHAFVFLSGESPDGLYMLHGEVDARHHSINITNHKSGEIVNSQFPKRFDARFTLDGPDDGPLAMTLDVDGRREVNVHTTSWVSYRGLKLPSEFTEEHLQTNGDLIWRVTWKLRSVGPTKSLELPIPSGTRILDFREVSLDRGPGSFPPPGGRPVSYVFRDSLPSAEALTAMTPLQNDAEDKVPNVNPAWLAAFVAFGLAMSLHGAARRLARSARP